MKSLEPKTIYTSNWTGSTASRFETATFATAISGFKYRILIRSQVPHVGEIEVKEDHVNLVPGEATKLNVVTGQEEGFTGDIAIAVEGLPSGVSAFPGTEVKPDKGTSARRRLQGKVCAKERDGVHYFSRERGCCRHLIAAVHSRSRSPRHQRGYGALRWRRKRSL
jgi:hypothetical protein